MKKNPKQTTKSYKQSLFIIVLALVAARIGFVAGQSAPASSTPQQIESAKNQLVVSLAEERIVSFCPEVGDKTELKMGKIVPNYRNIKINKTANRAIITDCAERDELFVKTKAGIWTSTNINLNLSNRANAVWLKECLIDDIVVADEIVREENTSIDALNLQRCTEIKTL